MSAALFDLGGRTALITGSSRGLGFALARGLAHAGARVVTNGRDRDAAERAAAALRADGFDAEAVPFDVTREAEVDRAIEEIESRVGPIEILVNNAGMQDRRPLQEFPADAWRHLIEVNVTSAFLVGRAAAAHMIERRRGKIVNVCSLQSEVARPGIAAYAATKGALKMLTKGMCADWAGYGLQINAVGPGYFVTEMTQALRDDPAFDAWLCARTPAGRWGKPEELVGTVVYLSSAASDFVNGQIIYVDGGVLAVL